MRIKYALMITFLGLFFSIQIYHTLTNTVHWPFNPMNLFHSLADYQQNVYYFRVTDNENNTYLIHNKYIVPLESFRIKLVLRKIFHGENRERQRKFMQMLVNKLNESPVKFTLNEMQRSFQPPENRKIVGLDLEEHYFDVHKYTYGQEFLPHKINKIFFYNQKEKS